MNINETCYFPNRNSEVGAMKIDELDILFLGMVYFPEQESEVFAKALGPVTTAANGLQWNLIQGLDENNERPVKIISALSIGSYPKHYKDLFVNETCFSHAKNSKDVSVGFTNVFIWQHLSKYLSIKPHLKKWAADGNRKKVIIAYGLNDLFVLCLRFIKRIAPEITTCIIVPDLPASIYNSKKVPLVYRIANKIDELIVMDNLNSIDKYVLLTAQMKDILGIERNYVVVEGVATSINLPTKEKSKYDNVKEIVYAGSLTMKYGVLELIEAFKKIAKDNYRLIVCGDGEAKSRIISEATNDKRIIYKGQLKRDEVLEVQRRATVLINPRQNIVEYVKYSFPSKNLEYLSAGKCVIGYKLDGIPAEYDQYMFYPRDNSIKALAETIQEVCEKDADFLFKFGQRAREFVMTEKNSTVQARKILDLCRE